MSTDTFAHRAFNRYCRYRKVPTIHLYHGLVRVQAVDDGLPYKINMLAQLKFAFSKLRKALTYVWPAYAASLWRTGATAREWSRFVRDIFSFALGRYNVVAADDTRTDKCCVYVAPDIEHAVKKYGFTGENVIAVGNPDLIQFGLASHLIGSQLASENVERRDVIYADTGLLYAGYGACLFTSAEEFVRHLADTREQLSLQGKRLIFKPHPDHWRSGILPSLEARGVEICPNKDYVSRLQNCCACIVEPTSAALIPALMGMPLFLASYGKLSGQRFGKVLTSYPRARHLSDLRAFNTLLAAERSECDPERTMRWIGENAGPLPAEDMPRRVAEVAASLIAKRAAC